MDAPLVFAHIGDLHLTTADAANARDLEAIVDQLNAVEGLDFIYLPGDNADHGTPEQYALVRREIARLTRPVHVITGDHDLEGGSLEAFYAGLWAQRLPYAADVAETRCLFLDMCGPGSGGPDFRLGADQLAWLADEVGRAEAAGRDCALFMHGYPADLKGEGEAARVAELVHRGPVRLVEMGHTHYNELANDGRTVYAACRSTGQIEEGPVGYAVVGLDRGAVSWRFKELARPWPFVLVVAPVDRRLADHRAPAQGDAVEIRAVVLSPDPVATCECRLDGGPWLPMERLDRPSLHAATVPSPPDLKRVEVRAVGGDGRQDVDEVEVVTAETRRRVSQNPGSDADAIGAWAHRGLLGTQLGPNRNGRQW